MTTSTESSTTNPQPTSELYYELRGSGPPLLLIAGTPGDGGQFEQLADILARDHIVITYDRVSTSRSATPSGWVATTVAEQADDAARLLRSLVTEPAVVYGTSNGAAVALELALRHPALVRRAILHEMPLLSVLADPAPVGAMLGELIGNAMQAGGPRAALDAFLRFAFGDEIVDAWPNELRERMLGNADMVFTVELPAFQSYRPDEGRLAASQVPLTVALGAGQQVPFFAEVADWLLAHGDASLVRTPDAHGPQFSSPAPLAALLTATT